MPISADKVKELRTRVEGTKLDFKRTDSDWATKGKVKRAEDTVAMASVLQPDTARRRMPLRPIYFLAPLE